MRNLKKILALVLALVMSMSLVVTANAFEDTADVDFKEAIDVLSGLKVFQGRTETEFAPEASITRAEVAAIIYRIVTADVENKQVGIYADYNKFDDVQSTNWFAGYVNYCANATYVGGYGNGKFGPNDPVTGYQALAMILRAVGYGKNGEFSGTGWEVRTASVAKSLGITDNILDGTLGQPATRETVAEILFRAILVPTVTWNMAFGYQDTNTTLGYEAFGLECIEGVVVANEFANLYGTSVLGEGETDLETEDGVRPLDFASELTDIGESRYAYVTGKTVLALGDTGLNNVFEPENGKATDVSTSAKFAKASGMTNAGTEYYVNFGREGYYTSDNRLEFTVTFVDADAEALFDRKYIDISAVEAVDADLTVDGTTYPKTYEKVIFAGDEISDNDLTILRGIFASADGGDNSKNITGAVYVNSKSAQEQKDISDEISYRTFEKEYINNEAFDRIFGASANGEWLKIVDNNNDGDAEYAFLTRYTMDKVVDSHTKKDVTTLEYNWLDTDEVSVRYIDEVEVGNVVVYSVIDGQALVELAENTTATINSISFKDVTITTTEDAVYGQSGISNQTEMDESIVVMDEDVEYIMYFDKYGYVRAYAPTAGTTYGLLTELYFEHYNNGQYVKNADLFAEMKLGDAKVDEYTVINDVKNGFVMDIAGNTCDNWAELNAPYKNAEDAAYNELQPATEHLGLNTALANNYFAPAMTNVAKYVQTEDGVRIVPVAEFAYDKSGDQLYYTSVARTAKTTDETLWPVYAVDYIELDASQDLEAKDRHYKIDDASDDFNNEHVNGLHTTEYYIVTPTGIMYFTDYSKLPAIEGTNINAIYAVARNTADDAASEDYWVADVVVIEVKAWATDYDSISLAYRNPKETSGYIRELDTLNNEADETMTTVVPGDLYWGREWADYGFYKLYDTEAEENGNLAAASISKITKGNFNKNGIFAGTVDRRNEVVTGGGYLGVNFKGAKTEIDVADVYVVNGKTADTVRLLSTEKSQVKDLDEIIWVKDAAGKIAYIIDVSDKDDNAAHGWDTPAWLEALYLDIIAEQNTTPSSTFGVKFYGVADTTDGTGGDLNTNSEEITISHATALAAKNADVAAVEVTGATSWSVTPSNTTLKEGRQEFTLTAVRADTGAHETYKLIKNGIGTTAVLNNGSTDITVPVAEENLSTEIVVKDYTDKFADTNGTIVWQFYTAAGNPMNSTAQAPIAGAAFAIATVTSEDRATATPYVLMMDGTGSNNATNLSANLNAIVAALVGDWTLPQIYNAVLAIATTETHQNIITAMREANVSIEKIFADYTALTANDLANRLDTYGDDAAAIINGYMQYLADNAVDPNAVVTKDGSKWNVELAAAATGIGDLNGVVAALAGTTASWIWNSDSTNGGNFADGSGITTINDLIAAVANAMYNWPGMDYIDVTIGDGTDTYATLHITK